MVKEATLENTPNAEWWIKSASRLMASGSYVMLFAVDEEKDEVAGFCDFMVIPEAADGLIHSYGKTIYIRPEYRKGTAAHRLIRAWIRTCKSLGITKLDLNANKRASDWKRAGFKPFSQVMTKEI